MLKLRLGLTLTYAKVEFKDANTNTKRSLQFYKNKENFLSNVNVTFTFGI